MVKRILKILGFAILFCLLLSGGVNAGSTAQILVTVTVISDIDTDGDGDLSGFDGVRQTLEEAIEEAMAEQSSQGGPWLISGREGDVAQKLGLPGNLEIFDRQGSPYEKSNEKSSSEGLLLPKSLPAALALAISGHSIWNGSSFLSYHAPVEWLGIGEASSALIMLGWTIFLIVTVLFVARSLMRGIRDVDSDF